MHQVQDAGGGYSWRKRRLRVFSNRFLVWLFDDKVPQVWRRGKLLNMRWTLADVAKKSAAIQAQIYPQASSVTPAVKGPPEPQERPKRAKPRNDESLSQQAVIKWWALAHLEFRLDEETLMAYPMQGARTARNGARLKKEGMRKGTLDMQLCCPRGDCCSLWIEMKTAIGRINPAQKKMLNILARNGAATVVCRSAESAIQAITGYLLLPKKP